MSSAPLYDTEDMMSLYQTSAGSYEDSGALPLLVYIGLPHTKTAPLRFIQIIGDNVFCFINVSKRIIHFLSVKLPFIIGNPDGGHSVTNKIGDSARF